MLVEFVIFENVEDAKLNIVLRSIVNTPRNAGRAPDISPIDAFTFPNEPFNESKIGL